MLLCWCDGVPVRACVLGSGWRFSERAILAAERALELCPWDTQALCHKGAVLLQLQPPKPDEAIRCFERSLEIDPCTQLQHPVVPSVHTCPCSAVGDGCLPTAHLAYRT